MFPLMFPLIFPSFHPFPLIFPTFSFHFLYSSPDFPYIFPTFPLIFPWKSGLAGRHPVLAVLDRPGLLLGTSAWRHRYEFGGKCFGWDSYNGVIMAMENLGLFMRLNSMISRRYTLQ